MKRDLLPKDEYYRPQRATALRRKADRLQWWLRPRGGLVFVVAAMLLLHKVVWHASGDRFAVIVTFLFVAMVSWAIRRQSEKLRGQATALEAEHQARYGPLPPAEAS